MQNRIIASKTNALISGLILLMHIFVLVIMPVVLLPKSALWSFTLVPLVLFNVTQWALIHEGIHSNLNAGKRANEYMSRGLTVLMGASFHMIRFGHLMHHKLNRDWQSEIVPEVGAGSRAGYFFNLLGGLYLTEVATSFGIALLTRGGFIGLAKRSHLGDKPDVLVAGERFFYERKNVEAIRVDCVLIALIFSSAFYLYGHYWFVLALYIAARALVISVMDNIYHYATPADNSETGKDLLAPKLLAAAFLNGNYHETHHLNSNVPWTQLPEVQKAQAREFDGGLLTHGLMQLKGPIRA